MAMVGRGRDLLKALAPPVIVLGYFFWRNGGRLPASLRFWALVALLALPGIAASFASDRLRRSGRGIASGLVGFAGLAWMFGGSALLAMKTEAVTLTEAERAPFVTVNVDGQRRLAHPALGFSVLHPGPGFVSSGAHAFKRDAQFYWFDDPDARIRLSIGLFKGDGESPASLRKLLELMSRQADALSGKPGLPAQVVKLDTSVGEPPRGELHMLLDDGRHYRTVVHGWRSSNGTPFAILIAVTSRTPDAAGDVLASFRP